MSTQTLRTYQVETLAKLRAGFRSGHRRQVCLLPTGAGKTTVAAKMIEGAIQSAGAVRPNMVLFQAHRTELIDQCSERLDQNGLKSHGVIMAGHPRRRPHAPIQVASVDTLANRKPLDPPPKLIIADECHRALGARQLRIVSELYPDAYVVGLTATPWRLDGRGLGMLDRDGTPTLFTNMVCGATYAELISLGHIMEPLICCPWTPDLARVGVNADGEFDAEEIADLVDTPQTIRDIVDAWMERGNNASTVAFAASVDHSHHLVDAFKAVGVAAEHLDGEIDREERRAILGRVKSGETRLVSNFNVLGEGWDCLSMDTEVLTPSGWRNHESLTSGDPIYSLNVETGKMEVTICQAVGVRSVRPDERMVTLKSQHHSIRVTEGHRFFVKTLRKRHDIPTPLAPKTGFEMANMLDEYILPLSAEADFPGVQLTDDELRAIAWFITDGGFENYYFAINQVKDFKNEIRDLIVRLGFDFTERVRPRPPYRPVHVFLIPKGTGRGARKRNGWAHLSQYLVKTIAPELHKMTRDQFKVFWAELLKGDGEQLHKSGWLWCARAEQADALMHMAVVRGFAVSSQSRVTKHGTTVYRISARDTQWIRSDPKDSRSAKIALLPPENGEQVWCATTPLGTLVTRRNGKVVILGNCPSVEVCILARPTASLSLYMQQVGRILRPSPGKTRALVLDCSGGVLRHGWPTADREWTLADRPRRKKSDPNEDVAPMVVPCPACLYARPASQARAPCPQCGYEIPGPATPPMDLENASGVPLVEVTRAAVEAAATQGGPRPMGGPRGVFSRPPDFSAGAFQARLWGKR